MSQVKIYYLIFQKLYLLSLLFLCGCVASDNSLQQQLNNYQLEKNKIKTTYFEHFFIFNNQQNANRIHVYIHGDGTPWIKGKWTAYDPTPNHFLTLNLMLQDSQASLYLGRPCYHGTFSQAACDSKLWTSARYSNTVIKSMMEAIKKLTNQYNEVVLIGYSGGAVIATLLAEKLENTLALVTIAGNLDIQSWAFARKFRPLTQSINPFTKDFHKWPKVAIHLIGAKDRVVPARITTPFANKLPSSLWEYPSFNHHCCWEKSWPNILKRINAKIN